MAGLRDGKSDMVADIRALSQNFKHKERTNSCSLCLYLLLLLSNMELEITCIYVLFAHAEPARRFPALSSTPRLALDRELVY